LTQSPRIGLGPKPCAGAGAWGPGFDDGPGFGWQDGCQGAIRLRSLGADMATPDAYANAVHAYIAAFDAGDAHAAAALFAPDGTIEDPYGSPARVGTESILAFYQFAMAGHARLSLTGPVRVAGDAAAFAFTAHVSQPGGTTLEIDIIDVFRFDESGLIRAMQAFWSPANMRSV
jgi:steroid delta-isomerase